MRPQLAEEGYPQFFDSFIELIPVELEVGSGFGKIPFMLDESLVDVFLFELLTGLLE